jgi:hypothetical protein
MPAARAAIAILTLSTICTHAGQSSTAPPGTGALIASLPLISVLGMIWLWRDTQDRVRMADHALATFWYVLPSLPMFLVIPMLLKRGVGCWPALGLGCLLTMVLYVRMTGGLRRHGITN